MAVSLLEQRLVSLEEREPLCFPFGPCSLPPSMETLEEEYGDDGVALLGRNLRRSRTWAGYAGRLLRKDYECSSDEEEEDEEVEEEVMVGKTCSLLTACSDDEVASTYCPPSASRRGSLASEDGDDCLLVGKTCSLRTACSDDEDDCSTFCPSVCFSRRSSWASVLEEETAMASMSRRSSFSSTSSAEPISLEQCLSLFAEEQQQKTKKKRAAKKVAKARCITTYMVQNLAKNTTRHRFLESLNSLGFEGKYDYVHVPTSFQNGRNQGFAFVNFVSEETAQRFASQFQAADGTKPADKLWRVAPADVQGFEANSAATQKGKLAKVRSNAHRPLVLPQGQLP